jgi:hypothetical protein
MGTVLLGGRACYNCEYPVWPRGSSRRWRRPILCWMPSRKEPVLPLGRGQGRGLQRLLHQCPNPAADCGLASSLSDRANIVLSSHFSRRREAPLCPSGWCSRWAGTDRTSGRCRATLWSCRIPGGHRSSAPLLVGYGKCNDMACWLLLRTAPVGSEHDARSSI